MTDDTVPIVLGTIRFSKDDVDALRSITQSGTSDDTTYPRLVRLYVKMGLMLRKHGIYNVEQLQQKLQTLSKPELQALEDRIASRVEAQLLFKMQTAVKQPRKK